MPCVKDSKRPRHLGWTPPLLGGLLLLGLLYFRLDPAHYPFPRCPVQWLTGFYCPGCGTQRAAHALLHGRWEQAARFNLLAALYAPVVGAGLAGSGYRRLRRRPRQLSFLYRPWFGWLTVGLTLLFTLVRNLPNAVGQWLAP